MSQAINILQSRFLGVLLCVSLALISSQTFASNTTLTPLGSIQAGNADGSIPVWKEPVDIDVYYDGLLKTLESEKPLYTITASNYPTYKHLLSHGQVALFEAYPKTFTMPVYRSHRSFYPPKWFTKLSSVNAGSAQLNEHGEVIGHEVGIAFPAPTKGEEVILNHILNWRGIAVQFEALEAIVDYKGEYNPIKNFLLVSVPYGDPYKAANIPKHISTYYMSKTIFPKRLSGGSVVFLQSYLPLTKPSQAWIYVAAQRRSRRAPEAGYDMLMPNSGGIRVVDEMNMFTGALDRYNWELIGKREMLIPYNNKALNEPFNAKNLSKLDEVLTPLHINPFYTRYERHRVWEVKATLKEGQRHIYKERIFYIDEDAWTIVMDDKYNDQGDLVRFSFRYSGHDNQIPGHRIILDAFYDLENKRYFMQAPITDTVIYGQKSINKKRFTPKAMNKFSKESTDTLYIDPSHITLDAYKKKLK